MENSFYFKPHLYLAVTSEEVYYLDVIIPIESGYAVSGTPTQDGDNWYITIVEDSSAESGYYQDTITIDEKPVGVSTVSVETRDASGKKKGKSIVHYVDAELYELSHASRMAA